MEVTNSRTLNVTTTYTSRGSYNEVVAPPAWVQDLFNSLEGRAWSTGIESLNKRGGFEAINWDCYGYAEIDGQRLAVIQLRRAYKRKSSHWLSVRKDYYLCGYNENGNSFAHPIDTPCRSKRALETAEGVVLKALAEIWNCDADDIRLIKRNGDVAFVPVTPRSIPADVVEVAGVTLERSHTLVPARGGKVLYSPSTGLHYVRRAARISHDKGQHPTAAVESGTWRVQVGERAAHWGFTQPTQD